MKIVCQYSYLPYLSATKGDQINELNFMSALSSFADVEYAKNKITPPCDILYTRANDYLHTNIKAKVKIVMASPYSQTFGKADFIATFTESWANALRSGITIPGLNPNGIKHRNVISIGQTISNRFKPTPGIKFDGYPIIGCFGRLVDTNYPHLLIAAYPYIKKQYPNVKIIMGVTRTKLSIPFETVNYPYNDMAKVLSACDVIVVSQTGVEWDYCGSNKVIEAASCGTKLLLADSLARRENIGNYKYFLPIETFQQPITKEKINTFIKYLNTLLHDNTASALLEKNATRYRLKYQSLYLKQLFNNL